MKKKLLSLLLALCFVMALVPMTAFAEGTSVDSWDGTADTSWYTDHKTDTEYPAPSGPPLEMVTTLSDILLVPLMGSITKS